MIQFTTEVLKTKNKFDLTKIKKYLRKNPLKAEEVLDIIDKEYDERLNALLCESKTINVQPLSRSADRLKEITELICQFSSEKETLRIRIMEIVTGFKLR